jgi:SPP1 gp7 family putative phage head morphogenesis protein
MNEHHHPETGRFISNDEAEVATEGEPETSDPPSGAPPIDVHFLIGTTHRKRGERAAGDYSWLFGPALWAELRATLMPHATTIFLDAFLEGARLGAQQRPSRRTLTGTRADPLPAPVPPLPILPFDFEAVNTAAQRVIATYSDAWWAQFSTGTQNALRRIIADAESQGLTTDQIIARVEPLFGAQRAMNIAVSETTNLLGMGAQETYRLAGFTQYRWATVNDAIVDPICRARDGQLYPISVPFQRAHPQCRCWPQPYGTPVIPVSVLGF